MKQKIKSITEAFSMQPNFFSVTEKLENVNPRDYKYYLKRIEEEIQQTGENNRITYYIGYDWNGDIMFKYIAATVNVAYYYTEEE